jgi:hypothetical protein
MMTMRRSNSSGLVKTDCQARRQLTTLQCWVATDWAGAGEASRGRVEKECEENKEPKNVVGGLGRNPLEDKIFEKNVP